MEKTHLQQVEEWEAAWTEYVEAKTDFDKTWHSRHWPGCRREHNRNAKRYRKAKDVLINLDYQFCLTIGIF